MADSPPTIYDESLPTDSETKSGAPPTLIVMEGGNNRNRYPLIKSEINIGRDLDCDIPVSDSKISRKHAKIDYINLDDEDRSTPKIILTDLGSRNGTYVNDQKVSQIELRDQDKIKIGSFVFCFFLRDEASADVDEILIRPEKADPISGLGSREFFHSELQRSFDRARCYFRGLSIILFEIDDFRKISETYGTEQGLSLMGEVGDLVRDHCRPIDIAARHGLTQFAIILPETGREVALVQAERLRHRFQAYPFLSQETAIGLTISAGVAKMVNSMRNPNDLIEAAETALASAQQSGRNQVLWHTELHDDRIPSTGT